jgi:hypothetical protein
LLLFQLKKSLLRAGLPDAMNHCLKGIYDLVERKGNMIKEEYMAKFNQSRRKEQPFLLPGRGSCGSSKVKLSIKG